LNKKAAGIFFVLILTCLFSPASAEETSPSEEACSEEAVFKLGREWQVQEGFWSGRWTRRGESNVFDALWRVPYDRQQFGAFAGNAASDQVIFEKVEGRNVTFFRRRIGKYYHGILSCDKKSVVKGTADWYKENETWTAKIDAE
jgi:hypothetical protein